MHPTISSNYIAHLSNLECEGGLFKWLLHLPATEYSKVSSLLMRNAVRMLSCQLRELNGITTDLIDKITQNVYSFSMRPCDSSLSLLVGELKFLNGLDRLTSFQLDGLLLPRCLIKMWLARACPSVVAGAGIPLICCAAPGNC